MPMQPKVRSWWRSHCCWLTFLSWLLPVSHNYSHGRAFYISRGCFVVTLSFSGLIVFYLLGTTSNTTSTSTGGWRWRPSSRRCRNQHFAILHGRFSRYSSGTDYSLDSISLLCGHCGASTYYWKVSFVKRELERVLPRPDRTKSNKPCLRCTPSHKNTNSRTLTR